MTKDATWVSACIFTFHNAYVYILKHWVYLEYRDVLLQPLPCFSYLIHLSPFYPIHRMGCPINGVLIPLLTFDADISLSFSREDWKKSQSQREGSVLCGKSCRKEFQKGQVRFLSYFSLHFYSIISLFVLRLSLHIVTLYSEVSMDVIIKTRFVSKT